MIKTNLTYIYLLFLSLWGKSLAAKSLYVCPECNLVSIKKAIVLANTGDTIVVKKGVYKEGKIIIDKPLSLIGENRPIVDGDRQTEIFTVMADNVTIKGFQIQNVGTSYIEDRAGIRLKKAKNFLITNNFLFNTFFGIYLEHSSKGRIEGNTLQGLAEQEMSSGNAIHLWYSDSVSISHNQLSGHRDGIYLEFVNNSMVSNNISEGNLRYGLHFMFSNDNAYNCNEFRNNGAGVAVMFSRRIFMNSNLFEYNWGPAAYGLLLKEIYDAEIEQNIFRANTIGIYVEGSNRIHYYQNDFIRNGWAIKIAGGCLDNVIHTNNFLYNTFSLAVHTKGQNNNFDGNYWSDYSGYDLNRDGIGDVPHRPVKLFSYIVSQTPEAMVLLRSLFVDLLNFSEKVSPIFTPDNVMDNKPLIKMENGQ